MSSSAVETLLEFLGGAIRKEEAQSLLEATAGDIEAAVAAYFSGLSSGPGGSSVPVQNASPALATLRSVLGSETPESQLKELLRLSGGSVEVAVNLYLEDPNTGRPRPGASGAGGSGSAAPGAAANTAAQQAQAGSEVLDLTAGDGGHGSSSRQGRRKSSIRMTTAGPLPRHYRGSLSNGAAAASGGAGSGPSTAAGGGSAAGPAAGSAGAVAADAGAAGERASQPWQGNASGGAGAASGLPPRAPLASAPPAANGGASGTGGGAGGAPAALATGAFGAGGSRNSVPPQPPQRQAPQQGPQSGQQVAGTAGPAAGGPPSAAAVVTSGAAAAARPEPAPAAAAAGAPSAATSASAGAGAGGTAAVGGGARASGSAAAAPGAPAGGAAPPPQLQGPRPLLDGNLIASVKRAQGPYPVAPLLPLPQYRRSDGSLFLDDQDKVPGRSPSVQPLEDFQWPMALGQVAVPLEFDTRTGWLAAMRVIVSPEAQKELLGTALSWLKEGKLRYGTPPAARMADGGGKPGVTGELFWQVEEVYSSVAPPSGPDGRTERLPGGFRLGLFVSGREFLREAAAKFPTEGTLKSAVQAGIISDRYNLRLGTTCIDDKLTRLVRLYRDNSAAELNSGPGTCVPTNVRILGPGLDHHKGVSLRVDVSDSGLYRKPKAPAGRKGSGKAKAVPDSEGSGSASGSDSDNGRDAKAGAAGDAGSDSDEESDADDGAGAAAGSRKLAGMRPASAARRTRARSSGGGGGASKGAKGSAAAAKARDKGAEKGKSGAKDTNTKRRRPNKKSVNGAGADGEGGGEEEEEEEDSMASPRPRKRAKRSGPAAPGGDPQSPAARALRRGAGGGTTGGSLPSGSGAGRNAAADGRFYLSLEFFITEQSLQAASPPGSAKITEVQQEKGGKKGRGGFNRAGTEYLTNIMHVLLEQGSGLYVGPDCDGAINTMDVAPIGAQVRRGRGAGGSVSAGTLPGANGGRSRADSVAGGASGAPGTSGTGAGGSSFDDGDDDGEGVCNLDALLDRIRPPSDLPQAVVPPAVVAHPKPFQLQGLEWMMRRERRGDAIGRSLLLLHPAWVQLVVGSSGLVLHVHRIAPYYISADFFPAPVGGTCGGFLCDEMGLGKSLQTLMLIVSNPSPVGWAATPVPVRQSRAGPSGASSSPAGPAVPLTALVDPGDQEPIPIPTTLLVTPANLQSQWVEEIQRHLHPGSLKWGIYRGRESGARASGAEAADSGAARAVDDDDTIATRRATRVTRLLGNHMTDGPGTSKAGRLLPMALADAGEGRMVPLHACDVVLVSYEVLRKELSQGASRAMPLPRLGFWRIVLDEAQLVANSNSVAARVVSSLYRRHAWVVTGTPISSSLNEVQGMCEFLSYEPFYHSDMWRNLIQQPYAQRGSMGVAAFRALLRGVMLRRSKAAVEDQLALPPCIREELTVELSGVERAFYDVLKGRFMAALAGVRSASGAGGASGAAAIEAGGGRGAGAGPSTSGPVGAAPEPGSRGPGRPGSNRHALDDSRRPNAVYQRAATALVELRQCCCHPQIVRREAEAAAGARGASAAAAGGGGAGAKGKCRLSMRQIMAKMVSEAYSAYDQAVAALYGCRLQLAALADYRGGSADGGGGNGAGAGGSGAGASGSGGSAAAAAPAGAGDGEGAEPSGLELPALMESIRSVMKLVSEPDLLNQAKVRGADGGVKWELTNQTAAYGGVSGGLASVAPPLAAEQARERKRRWMRLELDGLMLRCYIACLLAPMGTLQLLAAQANARALTEAHQEALARRQRTADMAMFRLGVLMGAQANFDAAEQELLKEKGQAGGNAGVAAASAPAKPQNGKASKKRRADGDPAAGNEEPTETEKAFKRAKERLTSAKYHHKEATKSADNAKVAAEVAEQMAVAADAASAAALAEAPPEVVRAAAVIHQMNEEIKEIRGNLGLEHVDFELAETELRRSHRQQQELAAAGAGAGPSSGVAAAGATAGCPADDSNSDDALQDGSNNSDDSSESSESSESSHSDIRRRRRRVGAKRRTTSGDLVGGRWRSGSARKKKQRVDDSGAGGAGAAAGDGGGGTAGLLLTRGGTAYQETIFRSEPTVRIFQTVTTRRTRGAGASGDEAVREKWHELQHLLNQQEELGLAADVATVADGGAAAAAGAGEGDGGDAAGAAGPSGSSRGAGPSGAAAAAAAADLSVPQTELQQQQQQLMSQQLQQLLEQQKQTAGGQGKGLGCGGASSGPSGPTKDDYTCPVCLDVCERRTITKCGHTFCTDCIHDIVQGKGTAPCPICRRQLARTDLFDSVPEEEAEHDMPLLPPLGNAEYGAKVAALLDELARMSDEDPGSKALVFSSWGRLLRLVQEALLANGVRCVSMVGGNPEARQAALQSFLHDPSCRVLLLMKSNSGGAAGLTLTVAHTAFMMEPSANPGLEAQAAARICRLGQDRPTRVVRIIARNTVEERVLALQQHRQQHGESAPGGDQATEAVDGSLLLRFFDRL